MACLHGGVFTLGRGTAFPGCHHKKVRRAVRNLVAQGMAAEKNPPARAGFGSVCRIHGRAIYRTLGAGGLPPGHVSTSKKPDAAR